MVMDGQVPIHVGGKWKSLRGQDCERQGHSGSCLSMDESVALQPDCPGAAPAQSPRGWVTLCKFLSFSLLPLCRGESLLYSTGTLRELNEFVHSEYGLLKQ